MNPQTEDALTRLARLVKTAWMITPNATNRISSDDFETQALSLIAEAREEQRRAARRAKNDGLQTAISKAREWAADDDGDEDHATDAIVLNALAACLEVMRDPEP